VRLEEAIRLVSRPLHFLDKTVKFRTGAVFLNSIQVSSSEQEVHFSGRALVFVLSVLGYLRDVEKAGRGAYVYLPKLISSRHLSTSPRFLKPPPGAWLGHTIVLQVA
jgi:hypothetical protein